MLSLHSILHKGNYELSINLEDMKEFLATWIIIQLVILGWMTASLLNKIAEKTYICPKPEQKVSRLTAAIFPIVIFMPESSIINDYCNKQLTTISNPHDQN